MEQGLKLSGANVRRLRLLDTCLAHYKMPFAVRGNWNIPPSALDAPGGPERLDARVAATPDGTYRDPKSAK
eukprot:3891621-Pyramimonas_sp.AAC.2